MLCNVSFLSERYPSVHRINGPNWTGHFKCEGELSGQRELFAGFCFCFCWESTLSNWRGPRLITVPCWAFGRLHVFLPRSSKWPQNFCSQRFWPAAGRLVGPEGQCVRRQGESLPLHSRSLMVIPRRWASLGLTLTLASFECLSVSCSPKMK